MSFFYFFFQAEDGIRDYKVTGVQTCALPIYGVPGELGAADLTSAFVGGDPHRVGRLSGDVGGRRAGDVHVAAQIGDRFFDLRDGWDFVVGWGRRAGGVARG